MAFVKLCTNRLKFSLKNHLQNLDKLDRKIISLLLSNGRESVANLSRDIGLSRTAVSERISRLERTGVITGYTTRLNMAQEDMKIACYLLISCEKGKKDEVASILNEIPEIKSASIVSGIYDFITLIETPDLQSIYQVCSEIESGSGVRKITSSIILYQEVER